MRINLLSILRNCWARDIKLKTSSTQQFSLLSYLQICYNIYKTIIGWTAPGSLSLICWNNRPCNFPWPAASFVSRKDLAAHTRCYLESGRCFHQSPSRLQFGAQMKRTTPKNKVPGIKVEKMISDRPRRFLILNHLIIFFFSILAK